MLRPGIQIPHRTTVRSDLDVLYKGVIDSMLHDLPSNSKVSIALDAWQSPFRRSFIAITAYYITIDWQWKEVLIGFEHLKGEHSGEAMAKIVYDVLHQNKLTSRLYCITTDNASNNGTMRKELEDMLKDLEQDIPAWDSAGTTIPCMAHVIQLAVKAMLSSFNIQSGEDVGEEAISSECTDGTIGSIIQKVSC